MYRCKTHTAWTFLVAVILTSVSPTAIGSTNDDALAIALAASAESVDQTLSPDRAFRPTIKQVGRNVELKFTIADGYHLYRDKIRIETTPPGSIGQPVLPAAEERVDRVLGRQTVFSRDATVRLAVADRAPPRFKLTVMYQGCAGTGVCYPPQTSHFTVKGTPSSVKAVSTAPPPAAPAPTPSTSAEAIPESDVESDSDQKSAQAPAEIDRPGSRGLTSSWLGMAMLAAIAIIASVFLNAFEPLVPGAGNRPRLAKGLGLVLFLFGAAQMIGVFAGARSLLSPLSVFLAVR